MHNFWLKKRIERIERKALQLAEEVYSYIYLTYGHARISALTYDEIRAIIPFIIKLRDKYGLTFNVRALFREMIKKEKNESA